MDCWTSLRLRNIGIRVLCDTVLCMFNLSMIQVAGLLKNTQKCRNLCPLSPLGCPSGRTKYTQREHPSFAALARTFHGTRLCRARTVTLVFNAPGPKHTNQQQQICVQRNRINWSFGKAHELVTVLHGHDAGVCVCICNDMNF